MEPTQDILVKNHFTSSSAMWREIYAATDLNSAIIQQRMAHVLEFVDQLHLPAGFHALDIGCGAGLTTMALAQRGGNVTAMDVAETMITQAKLTLEQAGPVSGNVTFRIGDAENPQLPEERFDLIIAMGLIEYLAFPRWFLQLMTHALKPGGHLIVTVPNLARLSYKTNPQFLKIRLKNKMRRLLGQPAIDTFLESGRVSAKGGFQRTLYTRERIQNLLRVAGLEPAAAVDHGFGPIWPLSPEHAASVQLDRFVHKQRRAHPSLLADTGSNIVLLARKPLIPTDWQLHPLLADPEPVLAAFRAERHALFAAHATWMAHHPEWSSVSQEIIPEQSISGPVLVLSPHPDDELIGCGGTLLRLLQAGVSVHVLQMTDGGEAMALRHVSPEERRTVRLREAEEVAKIMGVTLHCWNIPGNGLQDDDATRQALHTLFTAVRPNTLFIPFMEDPHPDHRMAALLARHALNMMDSDRSIQIFCYEVWSLTPANVHCVIHDQRVEKNRLLMRYITGMKAVDYERFCDCMALHHAWKDHGQRDFHERFLRLNRQALIHFPQYLLLPGVEDCDS
ncbi:MAG: methyltransferase domain-containing protein [Magnetococcales bacterium]|nr:methyltransferase domain-containing protein [Magnetococcales bacterium]